ncbi:antA/AntB antirepressor family protein [Mitsuaria sp. WAJ17]|uniref:antA/AntB antirepressor family protein n=1 Tax=Mitsuaria sp. WAJ17 TaxID=2761452 RepID=UPI001604040B|nr:antA/AntB antirepressor family protein [Mitsuaria sp. WAJ17]MBB2486315.1 antA/AntB antirepressor family protein [Mitsuaria sp. WAJ17]
MNNLIPVFPLTEQEDTLLCNARDLHKALGVGRVFAAWIKGRIDDYGFELGSDYVTMAARDARLDFPDPENQVAQHGGDRRSVDYHLTLDMAKELAMLENNDLGRQVRRYFIQREKQAVELLRQAVIEERDRPLLGARTPKMQIRAGDLVKITNLASEAASKLARAATVGEYEQQLQALTSYNRAVGLPLPKVEHFPRPAEAAAVYRRQFWELVEDLGLQLLDHSPDAGEVAISLPTLYAVASDEGLLWPGLEKPAVQEAIEEAMRADPRYIRFGRVKSKLRAPHSPLLRCLIFQAA